MTTIILYTKKIHNSKNNTTFDKPYISYRNKRLECVLAKSVRDRILKEGLQYPLSLDIDEKDYFMKRVRYTRNDGTNGVKSQLVLLGFSNPKPAHFEKITLDSVIDDLEDDTPAADDK